MFSVERFKPYAPVILRLGLSLVFLWFGVSQLFSPDNFIGYLPEFLLKLESARLFVILNGVMEIILGILLILGLFIRPVAFILALHLLSIIVTLGYNEIAVRDFGLMLATIAIFLGGKDIWSLEYRRNKGKNL